MTTDVAGNYIFDNLPAGAYVVEVNGRAAPTGYAQIGDPDQPGSACTVCDNLTTTPILLAPGDVYANGDFGYQPTGVPNTIGNQIYVDANGDGNLDVDEPGIPGVTVALLDAGGNVIAATLTDANGQYSFPGVPNGTYTVWVNYTANVLGELTQNSTPNNAADGGQPCGTCNGRNTVTVSGGAGSNFQDFGYASASHNTGDGLVGDTIYLDLDGGNDYDSGEGIEGVHVNLYQDTNGDGNYDAGEPLVASTVINENGQCFFGNLPVGNLVVKVDTTTLPSGVSNTVDPDSASPGNIANESGTNLMAGEVDLAQDFGYAADAPHTISGTLWRDTGANGTLEPITETLRFAGVTVVLYDAYGNVAATTITDGSGNYMFPGLPDGAYRVDVTDDAGVLDGYWHSQGDQAQSSDGTSKTDPYTVTLNGSDVNTVDFGYYQDPAVIGNFVWIDLNDNGVQEPNEPGLNGVLVTLTITYPNGVTTTHATLTGPDGLYSFGYMLVDEDFDGSGSGEPVYIIRVGTLPGMTPSDEAMPGDNDEIDGDSDGASEFATILEGETDHSYDFGFNGLLDLGDLPSNYPTLFKLGPANVIFPDGPDGDITPDTTDGRPAVWLGLTVDAESDGQPNANATGDGADEDGMVLAPRGWVAGSSSTLTLTLNSSEPGITVYYGLWIDWGDGSGGPPDGIFDAFYNGSDVTSSPVSVPVLVSVPGSYAAPNHVYFRARVDDGPLTQADFQGSLVNGEVEDYLNQFRPTAIQLIQLSAATRTGSAWLPWLFGISLLSGGLGLMLFLIRRKARA